MRLCMQGLFVVFDTTIHQAFASFASLCGSASLRGKRVIALTLQQ